MKAQTKNTLGSLQLNSKTHPTLYWISTPLIRTNLDPILKLNTSILLFHSFTYITYHTKTKHKKNKTMYSYSSSSVSVSSSVSSLYTPSNFAIIALPFPLSTFTTFSSSSSSSSSSSPSNSSVSSVSSVPSNSLS